MTVRPRALEWIALVLLPPLIWFGCCVLLAMVIRPPEGDNAAFREIMWYATWLAVPASIALIAWTAWRIGQNSYWRLDDDGITQGRWSPQRYPFAEIEALFVGMPDEMSGVGATIARLPIANAAAAVGQIRTWRQTALVLRLRDRRLLVVGLAAAHFRGGAAFREALLQRLADRTRGVDQYTGEERHALAVHLVASKLIRY